MLGRLGEEVVGPAEGLELQVVGREATGVVDTAAIHLPVIHPAPRGTTDHRTVGPDQPAQVALPVGGGVRALPPPGRRLRAGPEQACTRA